MAGHHWGLLGAEFGTPESWGSPTIPCGTEQVSPREVVSTCEHVWLLHPCGGGLWGPCRPPGTHRCLGGREHLVAALLYYPSLSRWAHVVPPWPTGSRGRVCMAPWGPGHVPGPTRAPPLPALFPEPPRFIKEPKDQIGVSGGVASFVCQATGDPKPRVTWNKKGKKVNSQRFEVSWG